MMTRTVVEVNDELAHMKSEVAILEAARQRETGIVPEREAAREAAQLAHDRAQAALWGAGEIVNGVLMEPYGELRDAGDKRAWAEAAAADPNLPTPAEVARLQRRFREARGDVAEIRRDVERAAGAVSAARERATFLGQQVALGTNLLGQLEAERQRARALAGTPPPSRLDNARARLARLRQQFTAPAAPKGA